jgi:hypothetical protein
MWGVVSKGPGQIGVLLAVLASCNFYRVAEQSSSARGQDGSSYEAAPARQVVDDGGPIGFPGTEGGALGGIGVGAGKNDAGRRDAASSDGPAGSQDASSSGSDAANAACVACSLGGPTPGQDNPPSCPSGQGCYRSGSSACCAAAGEVLGGIPCADDQMCAPGLLCVDSLCTPTCNTVAPACGLDCRPLAGYAGAGYCAL